MEIEVQQYYEIYKDDKLRKQNFSKNQEKLQDKIPETKQINFLEDNTLKKSCSIQNLYENHLNNKIRKKSKNDKIQKSVSKENLFSDIEFPVLQNNNLANRKQSLFQSHVDDMKKKHNLIKNKQILLKMQCKIQMQVQFQEKNMDLHISNINQNMSYKKRIKQNNIDYVYMSQRSLEPISEFAEYKILHHNSSSAIGLEGNNHSLISLKQIMNNFQMNDINKINQFSQRLQAKQYDIENKQKFSNQKLLQVLNGLGEEKNSKIQQQQILNDKSNIDNKEQTQKKDQNQYSNIDKSNNISNNINYENENNIDNNINIDNNETNNDEIQKKENNCEDEELLKKNRNQIKKSLSGGVAEKIGVQLPKFYKPKSIFLPSNDLNNEFEQKYNEYMAFLYRINYSNKIIIQNQQQNQYKVFIRNGNNFKLIKQLFDKRWWWYIQKQESEQSNCIWTQFMEKPFIAYLKDQQSNITYQENTEVKIYDNDKHYLKIFNKQDLSNNRIFIKNRNIVKRLNDEQQKIKNLTYFQDQDKYQYNHLEDVYHLSNKKALFYNIKKFCKSQNQNYYDYMPVTFHLKKGADESDEEYQDFIKYYMYRHQECSENEKEKNIYIIKPGEDTNRGTGIQVQSDLDKIKNIIKTQIHHKNGYLQTYIIQSYIDKPLLYNKRKFDIRTYILVTSVNGIHKCYWYEEGYIRTSSSIFNLNNLNDRMIHLTNDAIQKQSEQYGKFEFGNKISYYDFNKYLMNDYPGIDLYKDMLPQMKKIAQIAIQSVFQKMDKNNKQFSFEVFIIYFYILGLDYMIDELYKIYLIEVNTNPCLEITCNVISRLIPTMLENAIRIAVDPIFIPPEITQWKTHKHHYLPEKLMESNKFELIFDDLVDSEHLKGYQEECKLFLNSGLKSFLR